ncbi:hypothetical protein I312_100227 [Cryptococcus bacillisporus CA1280]|uniref:uncharacterized protein n=1 Tax=Cryptococcus bacillisporus CA1280 TaxID=1296109 RepID=UPI003367F6A4
MHNLTYTGVRQPIWIDFILLGDTANNEERYYSQKYCTFGLEWNDKFMWTYIDLRISQVTSLRFSPEVDQPWSQSQSKVTPFDQAFYLMWRTC